MDGTSNLPLRTATKRRHETLVAAARSHCGSENNPTPALDGMFDTLNKHCKLNTMKDYVLSNDKLKDRVVSNVYGGNVRSFENSPINVKQRAKGINGFLYLIRGRHFLNLSDHP